jgi:hypothetical protein
MACFQCVEIVDLFSRDATTHGFEDLERRRHADVRSNQHFLELVQQLFVDLLAPGKECVEPFR